MKVEATSTSASDTPDLLAEADRAADAGRQDEAFVLYGRVLAKSPDNLNALKRGGPRPAGDAASR